MKTASRVLVSLLIASMVPPPTATASAADPSQASFQTLLKTYRVKLDSSSKKDEVLKDFSDALIESGIGVEEVDAFVKGQLTTKEYNVYKRELTVSMKGLDLELLSPQEFSQVVYNALSATQAKGLTWSSCNSQMTGIVLAVASVIVGIIAISKKKLDYITEEKLYNDWVNKKSEIDAKYKDTTKKLEDPETYFNNKIDSAYNSISNLNSNISSYNTDISNNNSRISSLQNRLNGDLTNDERSSIESEISSLRSRNYDLESQISSAESSISQHKQNIAHYKNEKIRYQDPNVIAEEKLQLEIWYPQAHVDAEKDYKVKLDKMPEDNVKIGDKNEKIKRTKKTLGIIAGLGGATSAALILSTRGSCY